MSIGTMELTHHGPLRKSGLYPEETLRRPLPAVASTVTTRGKAAQFCLYGMRGSMPKCGTSLRIVWSKCSAESSSDTQCVLMGGGKAPLRFSNAYLQLMASDLPLEKSLGSLHSPPLGTL